MYFPINHLFSSDKAGTEIDSANHFRRCIYTSSASFKEFDAINTKLFQIKLLDRKMKDTFLAKRKIKITLRLSFTQLRVICHLVNR